jgi:ribosomal protein S6--L-glutamate ligase
LTAVPRIITDTHSLLRHYQVLKKGDIVLGRIRLRPMEEHVLLDLSRRGVIGIPSLVSQLCSRSKTMQVRLCGWAMIPGTEAIYTIHDLMAAVNRYTGDKVGDVVVKLEGRNAGLGVFRYRSIEDVYTQAALGHLPYPFVVQPFVYNCRDLRVIALDDYWEAYERLNPDNFRNNLHCGAAARPVEITGEQRELCSRIMSSSDFCYAHLDLLVTEEDESFLGEINLRGGLRGAAITSDEYRRKIKSIEQNCCDSAVASQQQKKGRPDSDLPFENNGR